MDYAVVPFENSTNGQVVFTYDLLRDWFLAREKPAFRVVAEQFVAIHHFLLSNADDLSNVTTLYSHPQVWGQVTDFLGLGKLPTNMTKVDTSSTAKAAEMVYNDASNTSACICSKMSADLYKLPVKYAEIEDLRGNTTRFLVLGYEALKLQQDKTITSLVYVLNKNDPGALCSALTAFSSNNINLTSIASRPSKISQWLYVFFVEAEGDEEEENMKQSIAALGSSCSKVAVLGLFARSWRYDGQ